MKRRLWFEQIRGYSVILELFCREIALSSPAWQTDKKQYLNLKKKKKRKNISWLETTFLHTIHVTCSTLASLWPDSRSPRAKEPFFLMCTNGLDWMWRAAGWLWLLCTLSQRMNPVRKTNFVVPCPTAACFRGQCEAVATVRVETKW